MEDRPSVLINWLVYPAVGHAVEAFKHAQGYLEVNPDLDVHLLLPPTPATALAPAGITVHTIDLAKPERDIHAIESDWDYLVVDSRLRRLQEGDSLVRAREAADHHFRARIKSGVAPTFEELLRESSHAVLPYRRNAPLRLSAPRLTAEVDRPAWSELNVCILPAGSTKLQSPSLATWRAICQAISGSHKDVRFHFTGRSGAPRRRIASNRLTRTLFGQSPATTSTAFDRHEIESLARQLDNVEVWWDCGFAQQLALMAACDLLIAPHTGFAFLAGPLGTPWLTLSCCRWPEYLYEPVPFHSIFPTCSSYPSLVDSTDCTDGSSPDRCLADLGSRIEEIERAAGLLLDPRTTYEQSVRRHLDQVSAHPRVDRFFFFDGQDSLLGRSVRTATEC